MTLFQVAALIVIALLAVVAVRTARHRSWPWLEPSIVLIALAACALVVVIA